MHAALGPAIAPGETDAERNNYGQVILENCLRQARAFLNPQPPVEALYDAFCKLIRPEGPTIEDSVLCTDCWSTVRIGMHGVLKALRDMPPEKIRENRIGQ